MSVLLYNSTLLYLIPLTTIFFDFISCLSCFIASIHNIAIIWFFSETCFCSLLPCFNDAFFLVICISLSVIFSFLPFTVLKCYLSVFQKQNYPGRIPYIWLLEVHSLGVIVILFYSLACELFGVFGIFYEYGRLMPETHKGIETCSTVLIMLRNIQS